VRLRGKGCRRPHRGGGLEPTVGRKYPEYGRMDIRPIKTEADYDAALAAVETLLDAHPTD
jgi:hypothetical protein